MTICCTSKMFGILVLIELLNDGSVILVFSVRYWVMSIGRFTTSVVRGQK